MANRTIVLNLLVLSILLRVLRKIKGPFQWDGRTISRALWAPSSQTATSRLGQWLPSPHPHKMGRKADGEMAPEACLTELRDLVSKVCADDVGAFEEEDVRRMAELFDSLDSWIMRGGFLPADWRRTL